MECIAIIPARHDSTRFPGKPLAKISGKTMVQYVFEQCRKALANVYVATDDERIESEVNNFKGNVIMTAEHHQSGTDRLAEAITLINKKEGSNYDVVINVQGDEPFVQPEQIKELTDCFNSSTTEIATLIKKTNSNEEVFNPNIPKVVINKNSEALYFSRSPIPYLRNIEKDKWQEHHSFNKHIGMYGYRYDILKKITQLEPSSLEKAESLEQNRWLENGFRIKVAYTNYENHSIDTPEDLEKVSKKMR
ncbi:MAG: 3-deoxy-manno-octulosonate cytidylyltransferase [Bacteroidales bacterium]